MITFLAALAIAAAPTQPPAPAQGAAQPAAVVAPGLDAFTAAEVDYAHTALPVTGWMLLSATHDLIVFYKGSATPTPRLWIRGEHYPLGPDNPIGSGESFVTLYELDCAGHRTRTLSSTIYSGAKMQGDIVAASDKAGDWTAVKPGGFTALGSDIVCKPATTAAPASVDAAARLNDGRSALQAGATPAASLAPKDSGAPR